MLRSRNAIVSSILALGLLLISPVARSEEASDILPFKATTKTLPNGLRVIVVPTGFPNIVSVQIPVLTGSRNEVEPGKSGFAHFFEHMMFRGTPSFSSAQYDAIMTKAGARRNAYTTDDYTNYFATFAKEDLETILMVEADRFQNLSYSLEDFQTEAKAVLGEYNKNSANPFRKIFEVQRDNAFTTHTYKHTTMGFIQDIEDMPNQYDYSKTFFKRWYRPENVAVIVAGDVDPDHVMRLVEKYWGGWQGGAAGDVAIPQEPAPAKAVYAHVDWPAPTSPHVTVAFHGPAFSDREKDWAAVNMILDLHFGQTSDVYKKLVEQEQVVDQIFAFQSASVDPSLITAVARVKDPANATYVRDELMRTFARVRAEPVDPQMLADAKSNARYGFARSLDNTGDIAATLASFVRFDRSYDTLNNVYQVFYSLTPQDLQSAANRYFEDRRLVVTTLSQGPLPEGIAQLPAMSTMMPAIEVADLDLTLQRSDLPLINFKLLFTVGSAADPKGKEGLAALSAAMISEAGSKAMTIAEINKKLYPMAGSFTSQVDKEMTTFTGVIHRDLWNDFAGIALPMLLDPGFREDDFKRLKDQQLNALRQDLRTNNEEELGRETLQAWVFRGTPYEHHPLGTIAGIEAITLDDVREFVKKAYARGNLRVGISGDFSDEVIARLKKDLAALPAAAGVSGPEAIKGRMPQGRQVQIIAKDTRATAISFGHPLTVTRSDPDFPALWLARAWLGEHRSSMSHLYQRIREIRGMNYGDYAYVEAFPGAMYQFFPDPNIARRAQLFEIWIRPVEPQNGHMALRIAIHEFQKLIENGMSQEDFEATREYLMKNVYVMTSTQDQQLGYALDSRWYGIGEFSSYMRDQLSRLTVDDVNKAIRKHFDPANLAIIFITKDAEGLKNKLVTDEFSPIEYPTQKPEDLLAEDKIIGAMKLGITAENVTIVPVEDIFAK